MRVDREGVGAVWLLRALTALAAVGAFFAAVTTEQAAADEIETVKMANRLCAAEPSLFGAKRTDAATAAEIMSGFVTIGSHPKVALPEDPTWSERLVDLDNWEALYQRLTWADPLRREYLRTGSSAMLEKFEFLVHDFVTDNPDLANGKSPYTWVDGPSGHRSSELACAVSVLGTPEWLVHAMETHAAINSMPERYAGTGNHAMMQNSGLLGIGCVLGDEADMELAMDRSEQLLTLAIDEQGVLQEGAYSYQRSNFEWWSDLRAKTLACGFPVSKAWNRIELMPQFLTEATQPTGRATPFGDTVVGHSGYMTYPGRELLPTTAFYSRGYLLSRTGWGTGAAANQESMMSLRYGQSYQEQAHGHMDAGNIEFFAFGTPLITDSGAYAYNGGPWRSWVKSPQAHNVVTVDGAVYRRDRRSPLMASRADPNYTFATIGSTVNTGANWYRTVLYSKRGDWILVLDEIDQNHLRQITQRWNLPDNETFATTGKPFTATGRPRIDSSGVGTGISVIFLAGNTGAQLVEGWESPRDPQTAGWRSYGSALIEPSPTALATRTAMKARIVTLIAARRPGEAASRVNAYGTDLTTTGVQTTIVTPRGREAIILSKTGYEAH